MKDPEDKDPAWGAPLFTGAATTVFRLAFVAFALFCATTGLMAYAFYHSSYWDRVGVAPVQPIQFSHRHHAQELHIDCRNCHATVETAAFAGMPSTHTCLACHSQVFATTTMIQPLVASAKNGVPLQWARVNRLPSHVYFDHSIHVAKGVACITCHGEVGRMALTVKGAPLTMRWCLDCHKDPGPRLSAPSEEFSAVRSLAPVAHGDLMAAYHVRTGALTDCSTCHH